LHGVDAGVLLQQAYAPPRRSNSACLCWTVTPPSAAHFRQVLVDTAVFAVFGDHVLDSIIDRFQLVGVGLYFPVVE
jgi:hypothetical protein